MQAYHFDALAAYYRGEVSLRKLNAMVRHLPPESPARWHFSDDRPYTLGDHLLWQITWLLLNQCVLLAQLGGDKKAKMPSNTQPQYPWSEMQSENVSRIGSLGSHTQEEVLQYLSNL